MAKYLILQFRSGYGGSSSTAFGRLWNCGLSTKLFVGGLSYDTNETVLKDTFKLHGEIIQVNVICDHVSGKSQGYGFVTFASASAASQALKEMKGELIDGRRIRVCYAKKR